MSEEAQTVELSSDLEEIFTKLDGLTLGQGAKLVKALEERWGVSAAAPAAVAVAASAGEAVEEEKTTFDVVLKEIGKKKWNQRLQSAVRILQRVFNFRTLYLGGGNARKIDFELPANVKVVPNIAGLLGGIALWREP